jgi:hypothetical protein
MAVVSMLHYVAINPFVKQPREEARLRVLEGGIRPPLRLAGE